MPLSERTKLEQEKSVYHDKMKEAWHDLSKAVSRFHSLEDYYDLDELTIERVDGWVDRINKSLTDADLFDGDSYRLMEDEDETE